MNRNRSSIARTLYGAALATLVAVILLARTVSAEPTVTVYKSPT